MNITNKTEILKRLTVLVADDDAVSLESYIGVLKRLFGNVLCAKNGEEALSVYKNSVVHMCIFDLRMPLMSGIELTVEIRKLDQNVPIIMVADHKNIDDLYAIVTLNVCAYIVKPLSYEDLKQKLLDCADKIALKSVIKKLTNSIGYDYISKKIIKDGCFSFALTKKESLLLELLLSKQGCIFSNEYIDDILWSGHMTTQALRNTVLRLRKKLGCDIVVNVQNQGYMILDSNKD